MPHFNFIRQSKISDSFKVAKLRGMFDIQDNHATEHFIGDIELPEQWKIGVIVGASGTGKTTIARELFNYFIEPDFTDKSVIDDMPGDVDKIVRTFNSVGFSSPPSWLKPYNVLSNGEKMRVQLAYALLSDDKQIVFDEYTSVVDRNVAKIGSAAIKKAINRSDKQFIAVTCHYDVLDWLEPDWVFDTNSMSMQKKNTPDQKSSSIYTELRATGNYLVSITI